jgi:hypothetical protein
LNKNTQQRRSTVTQTASRGGGGKGSGTSSAVLLIGWGAPVQGREHKAHQVLGEAISYVGQLQQRGDIDDYTAVALEPHGKELAGFVLLHTDRERLNRIRSSDELLRLQNRVQMVAQNIDVTGGWTGEAFEQIMSDRSQQARELGQS